MIEGCLWKSKICKFGKAIYSNLLPYVSFKQDLLYKKLDVFSYEVARSDLAVYFMDSKLSFNRIYIAFWKLDLDSWNVPTFVP